MNSEKSTIIQQHPSQKVCLPTAFLQFFQMSRNNAQKDMSFWNMTNRFAKQLPCRVQNYFYIVFCFCLRLPRLKYGLKIHDETCVPKTIFGLQINSDHTTRCRLVMVQARGHSSVPGTWQRRPMFSSTTPGMMSNGTKSKRNWHKKWWRKTAQKSSLSRKWSPWQVIY